MITALKPIVLWGSTRSPNPYKVAMFLEELSVPYGFKYIEIDEVKKSPFIDINPNGRVPAIVDPNNDISLWESGAIIEYLVQTYDKSHLISYDFDSPEHHKCRQWLYFQVSGQGPYYGQNMWFKRYHPEKNLTSAIERYANEAKRVVSVLDGAVQKTGWLVGDKCTFADLSFLAWDVLLPHILVDDYEAVMQANPHFKKWHDKMMARPAIDSVWQVWKTYF